MAVSSPKSAAADPVPRGSPSALPSPAATAPSIALPFTFILTGLLALFAGVTWLVAQPTVLSTYHYNQTVIAVTHLFALGWICSVVMGAMYQLVPVALETKLHSEKLARWQFVFHFVGFAGMVWMFSVWNLKQVGHFGSVFAAGVVLFVYNIARTLLRTPKWNITATAVSAALAWISLTVLAGLSIATAKSVNAAALDGGPEVSAGLTMTIIRPIAGFVGRFDALGAMHAHAHLGSIGCFTLLIMGVSYKLIPMFTLSELQSRRRAALSVVLLNVGLAGSFITILLRNPWKLAFAFVLIAALAIYGWELKAILRARKRKALDWGVKYFLTAIALFIPLSALAVLLSWPGLSLGAVGGQLENVYGFVGLLGVITFAVIGMLYKILPFLVWFGSYSRHIGRARVPSLADLYSHRLQIAGYWTWLAGIAATSVAILFANETGVRSGCALVALSLITLAVNVGMMLSHFFAPRLDPLVTQPKSSSVRRSDAAVPVPGAAHARDCEAKPA